MKKLLLFLSILAGCCFMSQAAAPDGSLMAPIPAPQETGLQPVAGANMAVEMPLNPKRQVSSEVRKAKDATAQDFIGEWGWSGINCLMRESLPNEGVMSIIQNPSDPSRLVVKIPVSTIELDAYVKDGNLYIPNQNLAPSEAIDNRSDVWFVNYTYTKTDDPGFVNIVPAENQEFYFQLSEDGTLTSGVPYDQLPDGDIVTNEDYEKMVCVATIGIEGEGYYWFCRLITATQSLVRKDGITYFIDTVYNRAVVVDSDVDITNAVIEDYITWNDTRYPVMIIGNRAFASRHDLKTVSMPSDLNMIYARAFADCVSLENIKIPDRVVRIGDGVFSGCYKLKECILGNSVQSLGEYLFYDCDSLKEIVLPNSVVELDVTFSYCTGLESVTLSDSLLEIPYYCFVYCQNLKEVKFGSSLKNIGYAAFNQCSGLENLELPASLENIEGWAFSLCTGLKSVTLPASLATFEPSMFAYDENLQSVDVDPANETYISRDGVVYLKDGSSLELFPAGRGGVFNVPDGVSIIGYTAFHSCVKVREIVIPESVEELGLGAFVNCLNLRSINIPEGVSLIPDQLLANTPSLTELRLPDAVETIEPFAFQNCSSLTTIQLGAGLSLIGDYAFEGCNALSAVYCLASTPPETEEDVFTDNNHKSAQLYVPQSSLTSYLDAQPWNEFSSINRIGAELSLSNTEVTLAEKEVFQLGVFGSADKVSWSSSDNTVAYANDCGLIVARKAGTSTVTAKVSGMSASCTVTVVSPQEIARRRVGESVLEPTDIVIESIGGDPMMVNLRLIPVGSQTVIDWSTSDSTIATVEDGLVVFHGEGEIDFSADTSNGLEDSFETSTEEVEEAGVFDVEAENVSSAIYTLQGIRIRKAATRNDIEALPAGFYIIGGKKVLVK